MTLGLSDAVDDKPIWREINIQVKRDAFIEIRVFNHTSTLINSIGIGCWSEAEIGDKFVTFIAPSNSGWLLIISKLFLFVFSSEILIERCVDDTFWFAHKSCWHGNIIASKANINSVKFISINFRNHPKSQHIPRKRLSTAILLLNLRQTTTTNENTLISDCTKSQIGKNYLCVRFIKQSISVRFLCGRNDRRVIGIAPKHIQMSLKMD